MATVVNVGALALVLVGCDALVDDGYRGEPLLVLVGGFDKQLDKALTSRDDLRAAIVWSPSVESLDSVGLPVGNEQLASSQELILPSEFRMRVFERPSAVDHAFGGGKLAIGRIVVYVDYDGSGSRDLDEPIVGGLVDEALLHAAEPVLGPESPTLGDVPVGFHRVRLPLSCGDTRPVSDAPSCDAKLGARCDADERCGTDGLCLDDQVSDWAQPSCVVAEPTSGCSPGVAGFLPSGGTSPAGWWLRACTRDEDCGGGRMHCDVGAGGCVPESRTRVVLKDAPVFSALCAPSRVR